MAVMSALLPIRLPRTERYVPECCVPECNVPERCVPECCVPECCVPERSVLECYVSERSAMTGSFFDAIFAGKRPAITVSSMLMTTRMTAPPTGRMATLRIPVR